MEAEGGDDLAENPGRKRQAAGVGHEPPGRRLGSHRPLPGPGPADHVGREIQAPEAEVRAVPGQIAQEVAGAGAHIQEAGSRGQTSRQVIDEPPIDQAHQGPLRQAGVEPGRGFQVFTPGH